MYLVLDSLKASPTTHNERIVSAKDRKDVNAALLEFLCVLDVGWEVVRVACGLVMYFNGHGEGSDAYVRHELGVCALYSP
jgi:hypothetical protein